MTNKPKTYRGLIQFDRCLSRKIEGMIVTKSIPGYFERTGREIDLYCSTAMADFYHFECAGADAIVIECLYQIKSQTDMLIRAVLIEHGAFHEIEMETNYDGN